MYLTINYEVTIKQDYKNFECCLACSIDNDTEWLTANFTCVE